MSAPTPELHILQNGIRLVTEPMPGAQSLVINFRFTFGAKDDPEDRLGMARIAEDVLFKGTPSRDARAVFDAFDTLGIRRGGATAVEYTSFQAQLLPRHFADALSLYAELFRSASFPDDQVEIAKAITQEELKRLEDTPSQQILYLAYQTGLGSPMGRIPIGEPDTVATITAPGVRRFWSDNCHPENLMISVAGGLTEPAIVEDIQSAFGTWPRGGAPLEDEHHLSVADRTVHLHKDIEQEHIAILFGGVPRGHDLYYAGQMAIAVLSAGGSSRLFTEVREKRGLVYSVYATYRARKQGGLVFLYAGTTADRAGETLEVCRGEIQRLGHDVTPSELARAKNVLKGQLFTTGELPEGRAGGLIADTFLEGRARSIDEIAAGIDSVIPEQIGEYLDTFPPTPSTVVTLGPRSLENENPSKG